MTFTERLQLAFVLLKSADGLEALILRIEGLKGVLERLESIQKRLPESSILESLADRLDALNQVVQKIEAPPSTVSVSSNGNDRAVPPVKADLLEWNRLKLLSKFVQLAGKAKEIEVEWQRIQQDEHDFLFAFQTDNNENTQAKYLYKKGIADGIKWCVNLFS